MVHDSEIGGHQGNIRTWKRACCQYYWLNMIADINQYIKTCLVCQRRKPHGRIIPPMGEFPEITRPLERVGVDLTKLPVSHEGYCYVLTMVDHLTKYLVTYPLRSKSTQEVTERFLEFVTTYGAIENLVSDRGTEVTSALFQDVCKRLGTISRTTTAFNPQGNGAVEVAHRTLKNILSQMAADDQMSWEKSLPYATLAMNTAYHTVVENTPFYLFFGRDAYMPYSDLFTPPRIDYTMGENYAAEVTARMYTAFKAVRGLIKQAHARVAKRRDKFVNSEKLQPGMLVFVRNERQETDHDDQWPPKYTGPYRVLELTRTNARIKHLYKKSREQYVQLHRCKYAQIRNDPFPLQLNEEETDIRDDEPTSEGNEAEQPGEQQTSGSETAVRYNLRRR